MAHVLDIRPSPYGKNGKDMTDHCTSISALAQQKNQIAHVKQTRCLHLCEGFRTNAFPNYRLLYSPGHFFFNNSCLPLTAVCAAPSALFSGLAGGQTGRGGIHLPRREFFLGNDGSMYGKGETVLSGFHQSQKYFVKLVTISR